MNRPKLERKISHLQNLLSRHYPMPPIIYIERDTDGNLIVPTTGETLPFVKPFVEPEPELTDIPEDEINQREEEQKLLEEKLAQIELDKLVKKKPRVKKT